MGVDSEKREASASPHEQDDNQDSNRSLASDNNEGRSSSLSELEDMVEEKGEAYYLASRVNGHTEVDSEAETERIDDSPQKLRRKDNIPASELRNGRSSATVVGSNGKRYATVGGDLVTPVPDEFEPSADRRVDNRISSSVQSAASTDNSDMERNERKRKREDLADTIAGGVPDCKLPDTKRLASFRQKLLHRNTDDPDPLPRPSSAGAGQNGAEAEGEASDGNEKELLSGPPSHSRVARLKRGKRRSKKWKDEYSPNQEESIAGDSIMESKETGSLVADAEEKDPAILADEIQKKKAAVDSLTAVESQFLSFRSKLYDDRLAQLEQELELLRRQTCKHPEYLAQLRCITDRRDERSHYETTLRNYKHSIYNVRMHAEHSQTQSQYVQTAREVRDRALESCGRQLYQLQKGRRQLGAADTQYTQMYQPKRTLQVQRHNAYNLEVSILSGVAKYVGFPAAPEVLGIESADVEDDFQQMKAPKRQNIPVHRAFGSASRPDQILAEERFLEQTPWANPQHPAHQRNHLMTSSHHSRHDTLSEHQPVLSEQQSGTLLVPKTHPTLGTKVKPSVNSKSAQATSLAAEVDADSVRRASPTVAREQVATKGAKKTNKSYASGSPVPRSFNAATSKSVHDTRVNNQAVGMNGRLPPSKQSIIQVSLATDVTLPSTSFGTPQVAMAPDYSNGDMTVPAMCETGPDATPHSGHLNPSAGKAATIAIGM